MLNTSCDQAKDLFAEQPYQLVSSILGIFKPSAWRGHLSIRSHMLDYLAAMSIQTLGAYHPVSLILKSVSKDMLADELVWKLWKLTIDVAEQHSSVIATAELWRFQAAAMQDLAGSEDRVAAIKTQEAGLKKAPAHLFNDRVLNLEFTDHKALLAWNQCRYYESFQLYVDVMERGIELEDWENVSTAAYRIAGFLERRGARSESEQYYRLALNMRLRCEGALHPDLVRYYVRLQTNLLKHRKVYEFQHLRDDYPQIALTWKVGASYEPEAHLPV